MRGPLAPMAGQVANQAVKGMLGGQAQKLIDAQVARALGPLVARIEELERRVAALEGRPAKAPRSDRSDDI